MNNAVLAGGICALLLFWGVGAHNRLVRLRAMVIAAFAPLEAQYGKFPALVQTSCAAPAGDGRVTPRTGLLGAALQFEVSLKVACAHPLDALSQRVLETAHETLHASWKRVCSEAANVPGEAMPDALQQQWAVLTLQENYAKNEFNQRVQEYNQAIHQFPANLLAWLFGFKPAYRFKEEP